VLTPEQGIAGAILVCLIGAALALALAHNRRTAGWAAFVATSISGLFVINAVVCVLADGPSTEPAQFLQMPLLGFALRLHVDGLSAVFLLLAVLVAVLIGRAGGAKRRSAEPWLCGYALQSEHNRYRAHGYYWELKRLVARVGGGQPTSAVCTHQSHSCMRKGKAGESSSRDSQQAGLTGEKTPDPEMPVWSVIEEKAEPNRGPKSRGGSDGDR